MHSRVIGLIVALGLMVAACGPAAQPTVAPPTQPAATVAPPTSTVAPKLSPTAVIGGTPAASPTPVPTRAPTPTTASARGPQYGGILKTQLRGDPVGWDPQRLTGGYLDALKVANMVFEPLGGYPAPPTVPECAMVPTPIALEKWEWPNDRTLDLKLRQGMKFHNKPPVNGREVTSDDMLYSLDRAFYKVKSRGTPALAPRITGMQATDRYTVRMTFDRPTPMIIDQVIAAIYVPFIMPKEAALDGKYEDPAKTYVGSAAFMFKEYRPGVKVSYVKNPDYWNKGLPYLDGVDLLIIPEQSTRLALFQSGSLDYWLGEVPGTFVERVQKISQAMLYSCAPYTHDGYIAPRNDLPPFNDVRVRRAMSMSLDRKALLDAVLGGQGTEAVMVPAGTYPWALRAQDLPPETRRYVEYRPDEAKKLLAEAGFPNGFKTTLDGSARYGAPHVPYVEAVAAMLGKVGIEATIKMWDYSLFQTGPNEGKQAGLMMTRYSYIDPYQAISEFYPRWEDNGLNKAHVDDPVLSKLGEELFITVDPARRDEIMRQVVLRMVDQAFVLMLPALNEFTAVQKWVGGFHMAGQRTQAGPLITPLWLEKR
ncbi:MAG: hypothetical protein HYY01_13810 [Chloroflexi bacterium]|nr:hypothetical protein [Chloroflexota bacterium]